MSNPSAGSGFWSDLIDLNKHADALIDKVQAAIEPSQPISREIPFFASIEARFNNLPITYSATPANNSDILAGNNVKSPIFTNHSSRVYVRELSFQSWTATAETIANGGRSSRFTNELGNFPFNWRWNFQTSITQRKYSQKGRVLARSGGRSTAGNHLAFRQPLIIEPMETFTFECELLSFGMQFVGVEPAIQPSAVVSMILSGYREGG